MIRLFRLNAAVILAAVVLAACETMPWQRSAGTNAEPGDSVNFDTPVLPEPGIPISPESRFADVPLPLDAKEDLDRTYVYESTNLQIGRMVYTTDYTVNELAQFYIKEMPTANWELERVTQAAGANLFFNKPNKRLEIAITRRTFSRGGGTLLILHLTPATGTLQP